MPFSQITQQRSLKNNQQPHTPRQILIYEKDEEEKKKKIKLKIVKSRRSCVYREQRNVQVGHSAVYELFSSPLNDLLLCFVWFASFIQRRSQTNDINEMR